MIPVSKAIKIVKSQVEPLGVESVRIVDAISRVLAEDVRADMDMPPFDRSQMDGYAVKASDTRSAPVTLDIVGESAAGMGWHDKLTKGQAVRIMTGARVPPGADAIQKLELASESGSRVSIEEATEVGRYIVKRGTEIRRGSKLFKPGEVIDERMIASLAAFGYDSVKVFRRPRVSILATGSEIVPIGRKPGGDQIRNSNSVMLKALAECAGGSAKLLSNTGDDLEKLKQAISKTASSSGSDILVMTGGVSVGKYDLTKAALRELGAELFFERVRLRPGKPTVFARLKNTHVFGLPGNPISAAVTFYLFVRPAIMKMQNASETDLPTGYAVVTKDAKAVKERDTYLPAMLGTDARGRLLATPLRWHGSSDFVGFARADALLFVPRGETINTGEVGRISFL